MKLLVCVVLSLALISCKSGKVQKMSDEERKVFPADTNLLVGINLSRVTETPMFTWLANQQPKEEAARIAKECSSFVSSAHLIFGGNVKSKDMSLLAKNTSREQVHACFAELLRSDAPLKVESSGDTATIGDIAHLLWLDSSTVLLGEDRELVKRNASRNDSLKADSKISELIAKVDRSASFWGVALRPNATGIALPADLASVYWAVSLTDGVTLNASLQLGKDAKASALKKEILAVAASAEKQGLTLKVTEESNALQIYAHISEKDIKTLMHSMSEGLDMLGQSMQRDQLFAQLGLKAPVRKVPIQKTQFAPGEQGRTTTTTHSSTTTTHSSTTTSSSDSSSSTESTTTTTGVLGTSLDVAMSGFQPASIEVSSVRTIIGKDFMEDLTVTLEIGVNIKQTQRFMVPHLVVQARCGEATDKGKAFFMELSEAQAGSVQQDKIELFSFSSLKKPPTQCEYAMQFAAKSTQPTYFCYQDGTTMVGRCETPKPL